MGQTNVSVGLTCLVDIHSVPSLFALRFGLCSKPCHSAAAYNA